MSVKSIFKEVRRTLTFWKPIKEPPHWVLSAYYRWEEKLSTHPYDMVKYFTGKHYLYKVEHGCGSQGCAPIIGWYKKKKIK